MTTTLNSSAGRSEPLAPGSSGYILTNLISHSRLSPSNATHTFKYNTLAVFVELGALERGELDVPLLFGVHFGLGLKLFGYESQRAICALRPDPYLFPSEKKLESGENGQKMKIREKLQVLLWREGVLMSDATDWTAWMLTMPSYLGFEGINPLTVYFVYTSSATELAAVVFEVHNTFGEAHVYFMKPGVGEDSLPSASEYTNQWTFRRAFHVSPFNDRTGFYTVALSAPSMSTSLNGGLKVVISIRLREAEPVESQNGHGHGPSLPMFDSHLTPTRIQPGKTKLTATLRVLASRPFVSSSSVSNFQMNPLLLALLAYPFTLLLSFPRILYQAGILHYRKVLDVYLRPEPLLGPLSTANTAGEINWSWIPTGTGSNINPVRSQAGITVRRQPTTWIAQYAKERLKEYLDWRVTPHVAGFADLEGVGGVDGVVLVMPDVYGGEKEHQHEWFVARRLEKAGGRRIRRNILRITPLSPKFFELLLLAPSAGHALLAGGVVEATLESDQPRTHSIRHSNSHSRSTSAYAKILNTYRGPNDVLFVVNDAEMFSRVFIPPSTAFSPAAAHPSGIASSMIRGLFSFVTNLVSTSPASSTHNTMSTKTWTLTQRLRCFMLPNLLTYPPPATFPKLSSPLFETEPEALNNLLHIHDTHFLDMHHHHRTHRDDISTSIPKAGSSSYSSAILSLALLPITTLLGSFLPLLTLMILITLDLLEPRVFALARARIVPGTETWGTGVWRRVRERVERVRGNMG